MSDGTTTTRFQYDGGQIAAEYNASNTRLRRYVPGPGVDEPAFWYEGSGIGAATWYHVDERGSVIALSNQTSVVGINSYDAYGKPASGNLGRFGYTGQAWLPELGMWYYKARIYNPANNVARFMQGDPIGYGDGLNRYSYAGGDPVNASDPTGTSVFYGPETEFSDGTPGVGDVQGCRSLTCHSYDGLGLAFERPVDALAAQRLAFAQSQRNSGTFLDWDKFLGVRDAAAKFVEILAVPAEPIVLAAAGSVAPIIGAALLLSLSGDTPKVQYVVRGGLAEPKTLIAGTGPVRSPYSGLVGFSVSTAPDMSAEQIALAAGYRHGSISYTTTARLRSIGYNVVATPFLPDMLLHATVVTGGPLSPFNAERISKVFSKMTNPAKR